MQNRDKKTKGDKQKEKGKGKGPTVHLGHKCTVTGQIHPSPTSTSCLQPLFTEGALVVVRPSTPRIGHVPGIHHLPGDLQVPLDPLGRTLAAPPSPSRRSSCSRTRLTPRRRTRRRSRAPEPSRAASKSLTVDVSFAWVLRIEQGRIASSPCSPSSLPQSPLPPRRFARPRPPPASPRLPRPPL